MMNGIKLRIAVVVLWAAVRLGASEGDRTICAHRNVFPPLEVGSPSSPYSSEKPFFWTAEVLDDNLTIRCHTNNYCFTLWTSQANNRSHVTVVKQGCWIGEPNVCMQGLCVSSMAPKNNSHFCCCSGDMCNQNFTDGYDPAAHTTSTLPSGEGRGQPLQDHSYKVKTIIISLVSVFSVALVITAAYFGYRMCLRPKQPSVESLHHVEAAPPPAEFDMGDLKLSHMISRGRYAEVWRGKLEEQDVAVKIYSSHYREYYNNERTLYRLPFMDHEGLVKFYGADERISQDGMAQLMIVMTYIPLGSLSSYLKNNTLDWPTMAKMLQSVSKGLSHLHTDIQKGDKFKPVLAHRDINTHNILVRSDLSCVITDLGFAVATMGSKLIKRGHPEIAEQTSLTDVGTLRYMAPELLDGAVNLRDCEASLKQIDIYALGLVLWEVSTRCVDLYQGTPVPEYAAPYQAEVGSNPTFEEMQMIVVRAKRRPKFPEVWKDTNQAVRSLRETIEECWDADAEARLTALCVEERLADLPNLWAQECKHRGMTPTLNAMINVDQAVLGSTDRPTAGETNDSVCLEVSPPSHCDTFSTSFEPHLQSITDPSPTPLLATGLGLVSSPMPNGHASLSPSVSVRQLQRSWLQDHSVSTSTTDTVLPVTPLESRGPSAKASNLTQERNNLALRPHQGRNPTVERNTHKRSDEELRVSGNTLISSARRDSLSTQSAPADQPVADSPPDYVSDGMDTSLVQNDALSHRNPPIPYLQNQVHGEAPAGRPKVANTPSLRGLGKGDRSLREKLTRLIRPKELGLRLSSLNFFSSNRRHVYSRAEDMEVEDLQQGQTTGDAGELQRPSTVAPSSSHASIQPIDTEVCMHNGTLMTRPASLQLEMRPAAELPAVMSGSEKRASQSSFPQNPIAHGDRIRDVASTESSNRSATRPENKLRLAEVGVAKLYVPHVGQIPVHHVQGAGHSKSTSELLHLHRHNSSESCWQETELCSVNSDQVKQHRPNSLSLKGHNYNAAFRQSPSKKSSSKPDVIFLPGEGPGRHAGGDVRKSSAQEVVGVATDKPTTSHHLKLQQGDMSDPSEKIRRRVKTPVMPSRKQARLSLYDDRLMSSGVDCMLDKDLADGSVKKSSTVCRFTNNNNNLIVKTCMKAGEQSGQLRREVCHIRDAAVV